MGKGSQGYRKGHARRDWLPTPELSALAFVPRPQPAARGLPRCVLRISLLATAMARAAVNARAARWPRRGAASGMASGPPVLRGVRRGPRETGARGRALRASCPLHPATWPSRAPSSVPGALAQLRQRGAAGLRQVVVDLEGEARSRRPSRAKVPALAGAPPLPPNAPSSNGGADERAGLALVNRARTTWRIGGRFARRAAPLRDRAPGRRSIRGCPRAARQYPHRFGDARRGHPASGEAA